ncbi:MAG: hypothetical protein AB1505_14365 [Candidatus Latescibacterota bacterium]
MAQPPWSGVGGWSEEGIPDRAVLEAYFTPWDTLAVEGAHASRRSSLSTGSIIGIEVQVPDFDTAPNRYEDFYSLTGARDAWWNADVFAHGLLVAPPAETTVTATSWARVKAALGER